MKEGEKASLRDLLLLVPEIGYLPSEYKCLEGAEWKWLFYGA